MRRSVLLALMAALAIWAAGTAAAEVRVTASPTEVRAGGIVDVTVTAEEGAGKVVYTLKNGSQTVFQGEEDTHFQASFRPRTEGEYTLEAEVTYGDGRTETGAVRVQAAGFEDEDTKAERIYSQKDGWWKDKKYSKSELDNAGCAIFTLSHALHRMGWTGEETRPENLAETYRNCYTKNGTANARLVYNAGQVYGYTTKSLLQHDKAGLREGLKNGDYYSFSIVLGHIALMTGVDEKAGKVRIIDSAPSATFERIRKGKIYCLRDGEYAEVQDPGEIPGARYYFETGYYGGLEYYLDLEYCARRGGRLIRPSWVLCPEGEGKIGAVMVSLTSGESEVTVNGKTRTVLTRELSWGETGKPRLAVVTGRKNVRLTNEAGRRIASVPICTVLPVLREEEGRILVMHEDQRGYLSLENAEVTDPLEGEIRHAKISVNGSISGRATVKLRFGPSEKERVAENWKTGTEVILIRQENDFWQIEARGRRLWIQQDYVTETQAEGT